MFEVDLTGLGVDEAALDCFSCTIAAEVDKTGTGKLICVVTGLGVDEADPDGFC